MGQEMSKSGIGIGVRYADGKWEMASGLGLNHVAPMLMSSSLDNLLSIGWGDLEGGGGLRTLRAGAELMELISLMNAVRLREHHHGLESMTSGRMGRRGPTFREVQLTEEEIEQNTANINYKKEMKEHECPFCSEEFQVGHKVRRLPCGHLFHPKCVDKWLTKSGTCPVCTKHIVG